MCKYSSVSVLLAYNLLFINVHFISAFAFSWGFMFGFVQIYTSIHIHYLLICSIQWLFKIINHL